MLQGWVLGDLWLVQVCKMLQDWGTLAHVKNNEQNLIFLFLKKMLLYSAFWYGDNSFPSPVVSEREENCKVWRLNTVLPTCACHWDQAILILCSHFCPIICAVCLWSISWNDFWERMRDKQILFILSVLTRKSFCPSFCPVTISLIFEISFIWHKIKGLYRIDLGLGRK